LAVWAASGALGELAEPGNRAASGELVGLAEPGTPAV
jgi:hypothetical protein